MLIFCCHISYIKPFVIIWIFIMNSIEFSTHSTSSFIQTFLFGSCSASCQRFFHMTNSGSIYIYIERSIKVGQMSKMFFLLLDQLFSLYLFSSFWLLNYFQMYSFLEWWILVVKSKNKTTVTLSFWAGLILHQIFWACGIVSANFLLRVNSKFVAFPSPSGILQTQNSYIQLRLKCL